MSDARLRAQIATLHWAFASDRITDWTVAIDGGAFEGHWSAAMALRFHRVVAFEPSPHNFPRAVETLAGLRNVELHHAALFDTTGRVSMVEAKSKHAAAHHVRADDAGDVRRTTIDNLRLGACGLIKLDVEGAEFEALMGARKTIKRFKPLLIVELKGLETRFGHPKGAVRDLLRRMGYVQIHEARPDYVFVSRM